MYWPVPEEKERALMGVGLGVSVGVRRLSGVVGKVGVRDDIMKERDIE